MPLRFTCTASALDLSTSSEARPIHPATVPAARCDDGSLSGGTHISAAGTFRAPAIQARPATHRRRCARWRRRARGHADRIREVTVLSAARDAVAGRDDCGLTAHLFDERSGRPPEPARRSRRRASFDARCRLEARHRRGRTARGPATALRGAGAIRIRCMCAAAGRHRGRAICRRRGALRLAMGSRLPSRLSTSRGRRPPLPPRRWGSRTAAD